jgi:uncharacterized membrane protein
MKFFTRYVKHLCATRRKTKQYFDVATLDAIEKTIVEAEKGHNGQIRFVVETDLPAIMLWDEVSARTRAVQLFSTLHIWDTEANNGVLIYVLLAEKRVELVADRGIHLPVVNEHPHAWAEICRLLEKAYRKGDYQAGSIAAIQKVAQYLRQYEITGEDFGNELPNAPLLL